MEDWSKEADMKGLFTSLLLVVPGMSGLMIPAAMAHDESSCDPVETAKLLASDGSESDYFGYSVAIEGDRLAIGSYGELTPGEARGAVLVHGLERVAHAGVRAKEAPVHEAPRAPDRFLRKFLGARRWTSARRGRRGLGRGGRRGLGRRGCRLKVVCVACVASRGAS